MLLVRVGFLLLCLKLLHLSSTFQAFHPELLHLSALQTPA